MSEKKKGLIPYKKTNAAPGSELHRLLSEGKDKEAEACYQACLKREEDLMASIERRFPSPKPKPEPEQTEQDGTVEP